MTAACPRPEYPRPQFARDVWLNLNGPWGFEIDPGDSGLARGLLTRPLTQQIVVPFCPESPLSGVGNTDFLRAVWYRRRVELPAGWTEVTSRLSGAAGEVLLHIGAADCDATVWAHRAGGEPVELTRHRGGWTPLVASLAAAAGPGDTLDLVVRVRDDPQAPMPSGKQSRQYDNHGCHYTRTTGIWQTVWLEPLPAVSIGTGFVGGSGGRVRITPDVPGRRFLLSVPLRLAPQPLPGGGFARATARGLRIRATLFPQDGAGVADPLDAAETAADAALSAQLVLRVPPQAVQLWDVGKPYLYDLVLELLDGDGRVLDRVRSYAGLRSVALDGRAVLINGRPVFQRLVLDQGYYPDGILTAPTDEALRRDIELAMSVGFNGARLHQKVFEERFLYHADRLGYLCWGELGDWGIDKSDPAVTTVAQWLEALHRDYSHPCIVGWCALNETGEALTDVHAPLTDLTLACYLAAKAIDPTRPVLDASGWSHRVHDADVYDTHDYEQDVARFAAKYAPALEGRPPVVAGWGELAGKPMSVPYAGQPYFVSEFGGTWWNPDARPGYASWGYGDRPTSPQAFLDRFRGLCSALLSNPAIFGYCYTQLTDVYQEQNGLFTFDRRPKFDPALLQHIQSAPAATER
ncbi:MAG: glycoside hydrolase family 2 protein [Tepidisphaerales bacterium]